MQITKVLKRSLISLYVGCCIAVLMYLFYLLSHIYKNLQQLEDPRINLNEKPYTADRNDTPRYFKSYIVESIVYQTYGKGKKKSE